MLSLYGGSLGLRGPLGRLKRLPTSHPAQLPLRSHREIAEGFPPLAPARPATAAAASTSGPPGALLGRRSPRKGGREGEALPSVA